MEFDNLIGLNTLGFVGLLGVQPPESKIALGADNEKGPGSMDLVESGKIEIASVENIYGSRLYGEVVEKIDLVDFAMGDENQRRDAASQIHEGMELDRSFSLAELSPGEKRETKVDGRGIEGIDCLLQLDAKIFLGVKDSGLADQDMGKIAVDAPVADLVRMSQGIARNVSPKAHVIELLLVAPETSLDIAEAFAIRELGEAHTKELVPTRKGLDLVLAPISVDA